MMRRSLIPVQSICADSQAVIMQVNINRNLLRQLWRFGLVGVVGFVVNAVLVEICASYTGPVIAQLIAFPAAATCTWLMNRRFTFGSMAAISFSEWLRYMGANSTGLMVNNGVYFILIFMFPFAFENPSTAVAAGSISGLVFNFATIKLYVFKSEAKTRKDI